MAFVKCLILCLATVVSSAPASAIINVTDDVELEKRKITKKIRLQIAGGIRRRCRSTAHVAYRATAGGLG